MSGASNILDPVGAAQDDIDRSKHLIASTLDELSRHHSWLESYHRDERRRAERLRRQEALDRLALKRQRAAWRLRRFTVTSLAAMRSAAIFLSRTTLACLRAARKFSLRAAAWTAPRAKALAALLGRSMAVGWSWFLRTALWLARAGFAYASIGFAWTVQTSERLGIVFRKRLAAGYAQASAQTAVLTHPMRKRASAAWMRTQLRSRRLASTTQARLAADWSRVRRRTPILARHVGGRMVAESATFSRALQSHGSAGAIWARTRSRSFAATAAKTTSGGWSRCRSWVEAQGSRLSRAFNSLKPHDPAHRALVVRRCTALVAREPWRPRLPALLGS